MKYKFQIENGSIYDGNYEIIIRDYIAEIDDITPAIKLVIEAHGGQLLKEEKPKEKRKVKPVKWQEKEAAKEVTGLLEKVKEMNEGVK